MTRAPINAFDTLQAVQAYMDDAAFFPEHFKPGVVRQHQRDFQRLQTALDELLVASKAFEAHMSEGNERRWRKALEAFL